MNKILPPALLVLRGLFRNPRHWGGVIAITLLVMSLSVLYLVTSATRLTPTQLTDAYLGSASYQVTAPSDRCPPAQCPVDKELTNALEAMGATAVRTESIASGTSLATGESAGPRVDITEADWTDSFHPEAYRLVDGRWPTASDEVAISSDSELDLHLGSRTKFYDHTSAEVVGVVDVIYVSSPTSFLADPGLIDRIYSDLQQYGNRYAGPDVQTNVRWDGPDLDTALPQFASVVSEHQGLSEEIALSSLKNSGSERDTDPRPPWNWFVATPSLWGILPVAVISLMAGVISVLSNRDFSHRVTRQLISIGIGTVTATLIIGLFRAALLSLATFVGMVLGWFLTLLSRPLLEDTVGHELSPVFMPWFFTLVVLALLLLVPFLVAVSQLSAPTAVRAAQWAATARGRLVCGAGLVLAVAGGSLWVVSGIRGLGDSYDHMTQFVVGLGVLGAILIMAVLMWGLRIEPRHLTSALPVRRMRAKPSQSAAVAVLSAIAVVIPLSLGVSLTTTSFYGAQKSVGLVPQGSVELGMNAAIVGGVPPELPGEVAEYSGMSQPARLYQTSITTNRGDGGAIAVGSQAEVEQILGRRLTEAESKVWGEGGLLTGSELYDDQDRVTVDGYTNETNVKQFEVPITRLSSAPPEYTAQILGFIPLSTVRDHDIDTLPAYYVFAGVSQDQSDAAARSPQALDFDPWWLHVYEAPKAAAPSPSVSLLAGALAATLLLVVIALARTVSSQLRPYGASLTAIGIGPGVLATTLTVTLGYLVILPLILGAAVAVGANTLGWSMLADGYAIIIPWRWVLIYSAVILAVIAVTIAVFAVRITRVQRRDTE